MAQINIYYNDFKTICRLCLSTTKLKSIFADPEFVTTFKYITNIKVKESDKLPKNVCVNCIQSMENIASFIKTCKNNDAILKAIVFQEEDKSLVSPEPKLVDANLQIDPVEEILVQVVGEGEKDDLMTVKIIEKETEPNREENEAKAITFQEKDKNLAIPELESTDTESEIQPIEEILVKVEGQEKNEDNIITLKIIENETELNHEENKATANRNNTIRKQCLRNNKIFPCKQCNKKFPRIAHLRLHIYSHKKNNKTLSCKECNRPFKTIAALGRHSCLLPKRRFKPTGEKKEEIRKKRNDMCLCVYCNKYLTRKSDLQRHLRTHTGVKLFTCEVCNKKFSHKSALIRHKFLHSDKFKCSVCDKRFSRENQLKNHIDKGHNVKSESDEKSCSFCTKKFKSNSYLRIHMKLHTGKADFKCDVCQKAFPLRVMLNRHYLSHTGIKEFKCDECDAEFNFKFLLNKHKKSHENSEEKSDLTCADCGKYFLFPSLLERHKPVHNQNKTKPRKPKSTTPRAPQEFLCSYCGKKFSYKCNLKVHLKAHAGVRFTCEICQKSYSKQESLKNHLLAHKGEKPYPCPYCGKQFRRPSYYKHILIHKGEKRFECEACKKGFIRKDQLIQHLRVHK